MAYATVTLSGTYQTPDQTPHKGHVEIIPSERVIKDTTGDVILTGRVKIDLDETGAFTVVLPATDDPTLNPTGFGYTIAAKLHSSHPPAVSFSLPAALGATTVEDLTPVDPSTFAPTTTYAESSTVTALDSRVTTVETDVAGKADSADLATVATTGNYTDLAGQPAIPATPADLGAEPAGLSTTTQTTITNQIAPKADRPAAITGTSPLRANRIHIGRALAITQGSNYSAFPGLTRTTSGRLVMAYRSASGHLSTDGKIVVRYSDDQGATWTAEATAVANAAGADKRDPALSVTSLGLTLTYFVWDGTNSLGAFYVTSANEGATWSAPVALPVQFPGGVAVDGVTAPMIELANGDLLVPLYARGGGTNYDTFCLISTDGGGSWTKHTITTGAPDYQEPFVQQLNDGSLLALLRRPSSGYVYKATSSDNGRTWTAPAQAFTGGDGRNAFVQTSDGTLIVCPESATAPYRPVLRASYNNGATWTTEQPVAMSAGDSGYAQMVETSPGVVALALAQNGHFSKCSVNFRYLTVGPRVTPLGDGSSLRLPSTMLAAPTGLLAWDSFERQDEANMNYSLSDSGHEWRTITGQPVLTSGSVSTNTNGNVSRLVVEAGTPDVEMGMTWKWGSSVNMQALLRLTDASNYLLLQNKGATQWDIDKVEGGVVTNLVSVTFSTPVGLWYGLRIVCKNNRIRVFIDGDKIIDLTLSAADQSTFGSKTLFGFSTRNVEQRVSNFWLAR